MPILLNKMLTVYTTLPCETSAKQIARKAVAEKIAACVNIFPSITSIYEWESTIEEKNEWGVFLKCPQSNKKNISPWIIENHPYNEPAIIIVNAKSPKYFTDYINIVCFKNN